MSKWGEDNQICVKISIRKAWSDWEVIYYRNKLPMSIIEQWRWYFEYLAALVKINNPHKKVELIICAQTLKQGQEYIEEKSKTLLRAKTAKLKKLQNTPVQDDFFGFARDEQDRKIKWDYGYKYNSGISYSSSPVGFVPNSEKGFPSEKEAVYDALKYLEGRCVREIGECRDRAEYDDDGNVIKNVSALPLFNQMLVHIRKYKEVYDPGQLTLFEI